MQLEKKRPSESRDIKTNFPFCQKVTGYDRYPEQIKFEVYFNNDYLTESTGYTLPFFKKYTFLIFCDFTSQVPTWNTCISHRKVT